MNGGYLLGWQWNFEKSSLKLGKNKENLKLETPKKSEDSRLSKLSQKTRNLVANSIIFSKKCFNSFQKPLKIQKWRNVNIVNGQ